MADWGSVDTYPHISYLLTSYSIYQFLKFWSWKACTTCGAKG